GFQPTPFVLRASVEQPEEEILDPAGHRTALTFADLLAVHRTYRRDLGGGAAHEDFVGEVEVFARQVAFDHGDAVVARQRNDRIAGNAVQKRGADRRSMQRAVEHQEHVFARAFAQEPGGRERDAFTETAQARLARDQLAGKIIAGRLGTRGDRVGCETLPTRHAGGDAVLQRLWAEVRAHRPAGDRDLHRCIGRDAEAAKTAERTGA